MNTKIQKIEKYFNNEIPSLISNCKKIVNKNSDIKAVYIVGGMIRDILSDIKPSEPDIAVAGNFNKFVNLLSEKYRGKIKFHHNFLSAQMYTNILHIDINCLRTEKYNPPGSLPKTKATLDIEQDLIRRDFTVNSIAINISDINKFKLIDPYKGIEDIYEKKIKVLHNKSFIDDPTRIFRAINYKYKNNFEIDPETFNLMKLSSKNVRNLSKDRIKKEMRIFLDTDKVIEKIKFTKKINLFENISKDLSVFKTNLQKTKIPNNFLEILGIILFESDKKQIVKIFDWIKLSKEEKLKLLDIHKMKKICEKLSHDKLKASEVVHLCQNISIEILKSHYIVCKIVQSNNQILKYLDYYKNIVPDLSAKELMNLQIKEVKIIGELLSILRNKKIDGEIKNKIEAKKFVKNFLNN